MKNIFRFLILLLLVLTLGVLFYIFIISPKINNNTQIIENEANNVFFELNKPLQTTVNENSKMIEDLTAYKQTTMPEGFRDVKRKTNFGETILEYVDVTQKSSDSNTLTAIMDDGSIKTLTILNTTKINSPVFSMSENNNILSIGFIKQDLDYLVNKNTPFRAIIFYNSNQESNINLNEITVI